MIGALLSWIVLLSLCFFGPLAAIKLADRHGTRKRERLAAAHARRAAMFTADLDDLFTHPLTRIADGYAEHFGAD